jgi:hypothetical protein
MKRLIGAWGLLTRVPAKEKAPELHQGLFYLAPRPGLEPGTYGLTVRRSTD